MTYEDVSRLPYTEQWAELYRITSHFTPEQRKHLDLACQLHPAEMVAVLSAAAPRQRSRKQLVGV